MSSRALRKLQEGGSKGQALPTIPGVDADSDRDEEPVAPATGLQIREAPRSIGVATTSGAVAGVPAQPESTTAGRSQAMPWRSKAAKIADIWGVPLVRSPSSSSAARN